MLEKRGTKLALLAAVSVVLALSAVAPAFAWQCQTIKFNSGTTGSSSTPIVLSALSTTFSSGNSISYSTFSSDYMYVYITYITSGWTVTITSPNTKTTISSTQIIVGPFSGSGSFSYTIVVKAPSTASTKGEFTINAVPTTSSSSTSSTYWNSAGACACVIVYLETGTIWPPPPTVPEFPLGMALLLAVAIPGLLLVRSKYTRKYPSAPV